MANNIKLVIRSAKDAENARTLYNHLIFRGFLRQARQVAKVLHDFGYQGWDKKIAMINQRLLRA